MITTRVGSDLDGVLIDSHEAIKKAYEHVGAMGWRPNRPWHEFATHQQHEAKNICYPRFLKEFGRPLPLLAVAMENRWDVLTGASEESVNAIRSTFLPKYTDFFRVHCSLATPADKLAIIRRVGITVYFDDDLEALAEIKKGFPICQTLLTMR